MTQQPGSSTKRPRLASPEPEELRSSGLKRSLHGVIYQFKLSMLFVYRALKNGYKFKIATELDAADKFDDIVLEYEQNGKSIRRFLQAKHKQEEYKVETKKIGNKQTKLEVPIKMTSKELLREADGRFYLPKYFTSYRKIMQNKDFNSNENEVRDLIICTNIDLDCEDLLDNEGIESEEVVNVDEILNVSIGNKRAKRYKLRVPDKNHELCQKLRKSSDLYKLAQELIDCLLNEKQINLRNELFKEYHVALLENVLVGSKKGTCKFQKEFFRNPDTKIFRETLKSIYAFEYGSGTITDAKFQQDLLKQNFTTSKGFLDEKNKTGNDKLPNDSIKDEDIEEFFDKLILAVNQPNEVELGEILKKEIGTEFNLIDPDLLTDNFQAKILNWLKTKDGTYLTRDGTESFFQELKTKLFQLILIGPSAIFSSKLKEYNVLYKVERSGTVIEAFVQSPDSKILIVEMAQPRLGSLKVSQTLARLPNYQRDDSFVFISSKFLLNIEQQLVNAVRDRNLLIVECTDRLEWPHYSIFTKILAESQSKLILITQALQNDFIDELDRLQIQIEKVIDNSSSFLFLTLESQNKVLESKVTFQGLPVQLGDIVDGDDVDPCTLLQILNGSTVRIGKDVNNQFDPDCFIPRFYFQYIQIDSEIEDDVQQGKFPDAITYDETEFKNTDGNVHLLQKQDNGVIVWKKSKGSILPVLQYKIVNSAEEYSNFYNNSTESDLLQQNAVIIADSAGMGKSVTLSDIAWKLKEDDASCWVVRIDLNDYTAKFKLFDDNFHLFNFEQIQNFLVEDVLNLRNFGTALFKARLAAKQKIVFLFDGLDEISPYYKKVVLHMIENLKDYRVFVTTRLNMTHVIEEKLGVFAYRTRPFSEKEQREYFYRHWGRDSRSEIYVNSIVEKLWFSNLASDFMGIPLQLRMVKEIFQQSEPNEWDGYYDFMRLSSEQPLLPARLNLMFLYERFLWGKLDVISKEKKRDDVSKVATQEHNETLFQNLIEEHQILALHTIFDFDQENVKKLLTRRETLKMKKFLEELEEKKKNWGIIDLVINNKARFVHRTFAEYLVADFFFSELLFESSDAIFDFFTTDLLFQSEYTVIRGFMNAMFSRLVSNLDTKYSHLSKLRKEFDGVVHDIFNIKEVSMKIRNVLRKRNDLRTSTLVISLDGGSHVLGYVAFGPLIVDGLSQIIYEYNLTIFFIKRAIDNKYKFEISSHYINDIIFLYEHTTNNANKKYLHRFVSFSVQQHRITSADLFHQSGNVGDRVKDVFNVPLHLQEFLKITKRYNVGHNEIRDIIFYTHQSLDCEDLNRNGISTEELEDHDDILSFQNKLENKQPKRFKLSVQHENVYQKLKSSLLKDKQGNPISCVPVTDQQIDDFFDKLIFAVDQPDDKELAGILKQEMTA